MDRQAAEILADRLALTGVGTRTHGSTSRMSICSTTSTSARAMRGLAAARTYIPNARFCDSVNVTLGAKNSISLPPSSQ